MDPKDIRKLRALTSFPALVAYLRDELDWPIEVEDADDITFDYDPAELGVDSKHAVKIEIIKQVRPLVDIQPWGIFYIEFETKRLPVVVLRRILRSLVPKSRRRDPERPVWRMDDLLFISAQGDVGYRSISFAHFRQREGRVAELRTFSWDTRETHFYYLKNLNLEALRWPEDETDTEAWREGWRRAFTVEHKYTIHKSQELAREMARHAATVRDLVQEVYDLETDEGPLHQLYASFKEVLLHDLTPDTFADMVAQTVAYGLFSAATQSDDLTYDRMVELIPNTNPFLKDLLAELTEQEAVDLEELGVGQLVELLRQTDIKAIVQDFGRQTGGGREDPVVHFYELFLSEYDKEQKVKRGVFYTPDPVVSYIVRSVDYLLKTEFGLADGLADTSTDPETGEPLVQILDPATGTGTFLAHVIDQIERTVKAKPGADWNAYVVEHLLPRLNGFELMMAPYAVAHMKLGLKLRQTGYNFASDERLRVYLTNTLEEPVEMHEILAFAGFLSKESNAAAHVKRQTPITVVIGNPPYAGLSANMGDWIIDLLRGNLPGDEALSSYYEVDGKPLGERKLWLQDDYVKFIRWAQWRIECTGAGILAFVTNHSYLDNPTFRGMRQSLMNAFTKIYVLDLHGGARRTQQTPNGSSDENVFDIQQGVAIGIFVKEPGKTGPAEVHRADLWGLRKHKYQWLSSQDVQTTEWEPLAPQSPFYLFLKRDIDLIAEYQQGWKVTEILPLNVTGIITARDRFVYDFDEESLLERIEEFADQELSDEEMRERYFKGKGSSKYPNGDTRSWKLPAAQGKVQTDPDWDKRVRPCRYRPFDIRPLYYTDWMVDWPRPEFMQHMLTGHNVALYLCRQIVSETWRHVLPTDRLTDDCYVSNRTRERGYIFPLYLYPQGNQGKARQKRFFDISPWQPDKDGRVPNLNPQFVTDFEGLLELGFVPDGRGDLCQIFGPEDVFHYAYAVFHSPTYRTRYAEFLKIDFPRLPLTSDRELFAALAALGADLVALHLLEDDYPAASWNQIGEDSPLQHPITTFVEGVNGTTMGAFSKSTCYQDGKVYLDTSQRKRSSYFDGVPEEVWNFHIGGYQVCRKWLYDRRGKKGVPGRTLTAEDIGHYQRIVVALKETIRLMGEIDEVIEAHGGWPIE